MRRTIFAGIAVTGLLLAGCGGDDDSADEGDTSTEESTTTEAEETTTAPPTSEEEDVTDTTETSEAEGPEDGSSGGGELTADGTTLAVGEAAVVAYDAPDGAIELSLTVTEVEESSFDDLAAAGLEVEDTDGLVPYFLRYSVELLSGTDVSGVGLNAEVDAVTADGQTGGTLITVGYDACRSESFSSDAAVGDSIESCKVALVPESAEVIGALWDGELDEGITWEV